MFIDSIGGPTIDISVSIILSPVAAWLRALRPFVGGVPRDGSPPAIKIAVLHLAHLLWSIVLYNGKSVYLIFLPCSDREYLRTKDSWVWRRSKSRTLSMALLVHSEDRLKREIAFDSHWKSFSRRKLAVPIKLSGSVYDSAAGCALYRIWTYPEAEAVRTDLGNRGCLG